MISAEKGSGRPVHTGVASQDFPLSADLEDAVLRQAETFNFQTLADSYANFDVAGYVRYEEGWQK